MVINCTLPPRIDTPSTSRAFVHVVLQKVLRHREGGRGGKDDQLGLGGLKGVYYISSFHTRVNKHTLNIKETRKLP